MRTIAVACALIASVALGGCSGEEGEDFPAAAENTAYEELTIAADTAAEAFSGPEGIGVITVQGGRLVQGPLTAVGKLDGPAAEAAPGAVTITETETGTKLLLTLYGYESGSEIQAAFVRGACGQPGEVVHTVEQTVEVPGEGVATLDADVSIPTRQLFDGSHSIRLGHPTAISGATSLQEASACADPIEAGGGSAQPSDRR
jgi:hypothetical protein